ncbi:iron-sulfur cluster biosynthesis family protein [Paenactinomyces guangxiensis]|uniref:Iron-sulfur cluster biosynthesis family protein n=1 Tax=Paenactinomyces guangxiensis TaxID=1490290 RepID=A0A7W1WQR7_9BACL|nr:iron-sulfur cluster biosynthesis family protein [Paenactinomyces guangxiensis]MBA4494287.1 iron-sulfur cluster biosynthesis family protein [Paenactinomyces guangxiensis]MBH8590781.1 iron-sulfur cluster biosynthesis family protein [Paenactinomyces guangxiensis]
MDVHVTPEARKALSSRKPDPEAVLRLVAMDEGCGCGADILFEMNWDQALPTDRRFPVGEGLTVVMDTHSQTYFYPEVWIEYQPNQDTFTLKNKNQIFLNHIFI